MNASDVAEDLVVGFGYWCAAAALFGVGVLAYFTVFHRRPRHRMNRRTRRRTRIHNRIQLRERKKP